MRDFFKSGTSSSSMRLAVLSVVAVCVVVFLALTFNIIYSTLYSKVVDYIGIAAVIGALSTPITGALVAKSNQTGNEK